MIFNAFGTTQPGMERTTSLWQSYRSANSATFPVNHFFIRCVQSSEIIRETCMFIKRWQGAEPKFAQARSRCSEVECLSLNLVMLNKLRCHSHFQFSASYITCSRLLTQIYILILTNSADPDQLASGEANWSGSTLFAKAKYIWVQQD